MARRGGIESKYENQQRKSRKIMSGNNGGMARMAWRRGGISVGGVSV
jgi:hypothetical protein